MTSLSDTQRLAVREAYVAYTHASTGEQRRYAKALMQDPKATATALLIAARHLLGPEMLAYEPDTLWRELDPCPINRDKLSAALALAMTPSFYWDYRVFGYTAHALNNEAVQSETVPRCTSEQMAWAAFEAELLFAMTDDTSTRPEFDSAVEAYTAAILWDDGFVVPPVGLGFCAQELEVRTSAAAELKSKTVAAWSALPKDKIDASKFTDDALGAQLSKLSTAWIYVTDQTKMLRQQLAQL